MTISVLIVAHNEEKHVARCIESVLDQTRKPDEVVLIAHNCSDRTEAIARKYPITVVSYTGPEGVPYARIKGFEVVTGDIVACIDGDSIAHRKWVRQITKPLLDPSVTLVAGYVVLTNNFFARLTSIWQFIFLKKIVRLNLNTFAWGSNFACRKEDYERVDGIAPIIVLKETLKLHFWAEDFYISRALMQIGKIRLALKAKTYTTLPQWKIDLRTAPTRKWMEDNQAIIGYFRKHPIAK